MRLTLHLLTRNGTDNKLDLIGSNVKDVLSVVLASVGMAVPVIETSSIDV